MALVENAWYMNYGNGTNTGYYAVAQWTALTVYAAGTLVRQLAAPAVGSERVFVCIIAGTSLASEPTWVITRGAKTAEAAGPTWQEVTGLSAVNGDLTNTPSWTITATPPGGVKATAVILGQIIKRDNGASYQICSTSGTAGSGAEPAFSDTAGTTTADNTVTWTSLGVVGNFAGWAAPLARLATAFSRMLVGNTLFVGSNHAETQASSMSPTCVGLASNPCKVLCVNQAGSVPPVSADIQTTPTATITTTSTSTITLDGSASYQGIIFNNGTAGGASHLILGGASGGGNAGVFMQFVDCSLRLVGTGTGVISVGGAASDVFINWKNTTLSFSAVGQTIQMRGYLLWEDTPSALLGTMPTKLFAWFSGQYAKVVAQGIDFSAMGVGKTLIDAATLNTQQGVVEFIDCKIDAAVTKADVPQTFVQMQISMLRTGATGVNYNQYLSLAEGLLNVDITVVRTGGATNGTTGIAWKIDTTSRANWFLPFSAPVIAIWNTVTGSAVTATIQGIWGGGAVPNNDNIWIDAEYLGDGSSPLGSFASNTKADALATATALPAGTGTWSGSTTKFALAVTFTPQQAGWVFLYVRAGLASSTFYIDPLVTLT